METITKISAWIGGLFLLACTLAFMARVIKVIYFGF